MTIEELLEQNKHQLQGMSVVQSSLEPLLISNAPPAPTDEEFICVNEIKKLKAISEQEELTYEQTKKLEIYVKTLISIRGKKEKPAEDTTKLSDAELFASIEK